MNDFLCPWPYAAKPYIQFEFDVDRLRVYLTFRHPMDTTVTPSVNLFVIRIDGADRTPSTIGWKDSYRLNMVVMTVAVHPARVHCTYLGPSETFRINWQKQFEPWYRILCNDVPLDWEHVLDVDVPNARVTVNGVLALSTITLTAGVYNNLDATDHNVIFFDASGGLIVLGGFTGGVDGQIIQATRIEDSANDVVLAHNVPAATQKIFTHVGANETLNGEYGGWTLSCNGTSWFDVSHARHV
ncbi:hypothetical protein ES703_30888 [subsurface metagenome]